MFAKDAYELTDSFLSVAYECSVDQDLKPSYSQEEIWNVLKEGDTLTLDLYKLIHEYMMEGQWLVQTMLDEKSVTGQGMYGASGLKSPQSIFMDGVDTYWPNYDAGAKAYTIWNFTESISIYQFKVRAEEYSNYGHFASEIYLYCGMDETHQSYDYGVALKTEQRAGWQLFESVDEHNPMKGKYWRIIIHKAFEMNRYCEIAQVDMRGFLCD